MRKLQQNRQEQRQFRNPSDLGLRVNNIFGTEKALREQLKSTQRAREQSDFVILWEPKILCIVSLQT